MRTLAFFSAVTVLSVVLGAGGVFAQAPAKPAKPAASAKPATKPAAPPAAKPETTKSATTPAATPAKTPAATAPITVGTEKKRDALPTDGSTREPAVASNELRLRQLAELVEDLKNKVTATKYRLQLLKEAMTSEKESIGGAKIQIVHENKMGGVYRLVRVRYFLDGKLIQSLTESNTKDKSLLSSKKINIFSDHISTGNKRLRVFITYQGNGYGVFAYVKKWKWEVHNTYSFTVAPGKLHVLSVIGSEKGGFTTPLAKRPQIKFTLVTKPLVVKENKDAGKKKSK